MNILFSCVCAVAARLCTAAIHLALPSRITALKGVPIVRLTLAS